MDLQGIAAIAQLAAYVSGVLAAFMGVAALIWMVGRGARRRTLFLVILDGVGLTMIFGPVVLAGCAPARWPTGWPSSRSPGSCWS